MRRVLTVIEPLSGRVLFELDSIEDAQQKPELWAVAHAAQDFTHKDVQLSRIDKVGT